MLPESLYKTIVGTHWTEENRGRGWKEKEPLERRRRRKKVRESQVGDSCDSPHPVDRTMDILTGTYSSSAFVAHPAQAYSGSPLRHAGL